MELARQEVRLAALLHDVGHAAFSHAAEAVVLKDRNHEWLSLKIVRETELLGSLLDQLYGEGCSERVARIIEGMGEGKLAPQLQVLHDIVSGQMDADRTDYLLRDAYHCGVDYGRFDYNTLVEALDVVQEEFSLELAIQREGIHALEALILARYHMNTQVYFHRVRRIYDLYLVKYHEALGADAPNTPDSILANNDTTMMNRIMQDADGEENSRHKWARRIVGREHHRVVYETGVNANTEDLKRTQRVMTALQAQYGDCEHLMDVADGSIHKLLMPEDTKDDKRVSLYVTGVGKSLNQAGHLSQILSKIPRSFQCARIYADLNCDQNELRETMRQAARQAAQ